MTAVPFDTLKMARGKMARGKMARGLEDGGFTAEQARAAVTALAEAATGAELATKSDLARLETQISADLHLLEQRMTIRAVGMLIVLAGVLLAAIRYLPAH